MGIFVTTDGFVKKTYEDHKTYYENVFKGVFGESVDLDPRGPIGQMVAQFALRDTNIWDGAEEIYNSRNPNSAEGVSLDNISAETGVIRQAEGKTYVSNVYLYGDLGTTIPAESLARETSNDLNYVLQSDVPISLDTVRYIDLTIGSVSSDEVFSLTIDGTLYSYTSLIDDEPVDVWTALKALVDAGTFAGDLTVTDDTLNIQQTATDFIIAYSANIDLELIAAGGDFEAEIAGANILPTLALDTIVTPISGWDTVSNTAAGITGRLEETDPELRIRRAATQLVGNATDEAIRNKVLNNVDGVSSVSVLSNRTDVTDGDGLPPHSFETVVVGGDDEDIANTIWLVMPSGIRSYGNQSEIVKDSQGTDQTIYFSRPVAKYIWVKVQRDLYDEEEYPANGDTQIKTEIVNWSLNNFPVGKDVIRQRLTIPIYNVPGISDILITIDATDTPSGTPVYAENDIDIAIREYATFDVSRISVEDLT